MKMALEPDFVKAFSDIVLAYQRRIIEIYYGAIGKYIHFTCSADDYATQSSMFVSLDMFNELVKPYFKERLAYTKKYTDAAILHHSCGAISQMVNDIIDSGVDIINPIQPGAKNMDPQTLKEQFGTRVTFHGGLDTQTVLPFGTREDVAREVNGLLRVMSKDGGYIFAAAHNIQEDVPPQNVIQMFKSAREFQC